MFRQLLNTEESLIVQQETLHPNTTAGTLTALFDINGNLDIEKLHSALQAVINRHPLLHATTSRDQTRDQTRNQIIFSQMTINRNNHWPLHYIDISDKYSNAPAIENFESTLSAIEQIKLLKTPFQLHEGPLWRCILLKVGKQQYQLCLLFHTLIADSQTIVIFMRDLCSAYTQLLEGNLSPQFPPLPPQISEIDAYEKQKNLAYWRNQLEATTLLDLPVDYLQPNHFPYPGTRIPFQIESGFLKSLQGSTFATTEEILLTAIYITLFRYSNQNDFCIGFIPYNTKEHAIIGHTLNVLPLRIRCQDIITIEELLRTIKDLRQQATNHQLPLTSILFDALSPRTSRALPNSQLFNVLIQIADATAIPTFPGTSLTGPFELDMGHCRFPYYGIKLNKMPDNSLVGYIEFNTNLFKSNTIDRLKTHILNCLQAFATNKKSAINFIPLLSSEEMHAISEFNQTQQAPVFTGTVPDFLHELAIRYPTHTALVFHNTNHTKDSIDYLYFDQAVSRLANYIKTYNTSPKKTVGVCVMRSSDLIIAMFAVMRAGYVMVPIAANTEFASNDHREKATQARQYKIKTAEIMLVITDNDTTKWFEDISSINICDPETERKIAAENDQFFPAPVQGMDPVYIMFTSATSSGIPKGVVLSHQGFSNLLNALMHNAINLVTPPNSPAPTKSLCNAPQEFDAFLYDILTVFAAAHGKHKMPGTLHLTSEEDRVSVSVMERIIYQEQITNIVILPETMNRLNPALPISHLICMGATPHHETMTRWATDHEWVGNGFGLTETGICLSVYQYIAGADHMLIGRPISNMQMFILEPTSLMVCPIGIIGEIFVAGPGVALSYLNAPDKANAQFLTVKYDQEHQRFIKCEPSAPSDQTIRLYATGDFGSFQLSHHNTLAIRCTGRKDRRIKIHGTQVELNAVEDALRKMPIVKDVVVIENDSRNGLIAYIVPTDKITSAELTAAIKHYLSSNTLLPAIGYPRTCITLTYLPTTTNGKVDVRALPKPNDLPSPLVAQPQNELQRKLRSIWATLLDIGENQIGINQHFISELGGNSILRAHLKTMIEGLPDARENIKTLLLPFDPTIEQLESKLKPFIQPPGPSTLRSISLFPKAAAGSIPLKLAPLPFLQPPGPPSMPKSPPTSK